ncbi:CU044_5270 family protein [Nonomuraea sp. NPDC001699]
MEERAEFFSWTGRSRDDGTSFYGRDFPAEPQTRADADAWRAAGSPSSWEIRSSDRTRTITSKAGPWTEDAPDARSGGVFDIGGLGRFTYQKLQNLPTDPEGLRKLLCEGSIELADGRTGMPKQCREPKSVLEQVVALLADTPVPPKVRAGLMRLITDYPGVQRLGAVEDPLGRAAVGLAAPFESADGRGTIQHQVLFDPRTGKLLGRRDLQLEPGPDSEKWQVTGKVLDYLAIADSGWTDAVPAPPE